MNFSEFIDKRIKKVKSMLKILKFKLIQMNISEDDYKIILTFWYRLERQSKKIKKLKTRKILLR